MLLPAADEGSCDLMEEKGCRGSRRDPWHSTPSWDSETAEGRQEEALRREVVPDPPTPPRRPRESLSLLPAGSDGTPTTKSPSSRRSRSAAGELSVQGRVTAVTLRPACHQAAQVCIRFHWPRMRVGGMTGTTSFLMLQPQNRPQHFSHPHLPADDLGSNLLKPLGRPL